MWLMEKQIADEDRRRQMGRSLSFISSPKNKAENRLAGSSPVRSFLQPLHRRTQNDARRGKSASTRCTCRHSYVYRREPAAAGTPELRYSRLSPARRRSFALLTIKFVPCSEECFKTTELAFVLRKLVCFSPCLQETVISTAGEESRESGILSRSGEIPRMLPARCRLREFYPRTVPQLRGSWTALLRRGRERGWRSRALSCPRTAVEAVACAGATLLRDLVERLVVVWQMDALPGSLR